MTAAVCAVTASADTLRNLLVYLSAASRSAYGVRPIALPRRGGHSVRWSPPIRLSCRQISTLRPIKNTAMVSQGRREIIRRSVGFRQTTDG